MPNTRAIDRFLTLPVECRRCDVGTHDLHLRVIVSANEVIMFAGPKEPAGPPSRRWVLSFVCPISGLRASSEVDGARMGSGTIQSVSVVDSIPTDAPSESADTFEAAYAEEWRQMTRDSIAVARDYGKTMLNTSAAAVPAFFAALALVRDGRSNTGMVVGLEIALSALYFAAMVTFGIAVQPALTSVSTLADFVEWRRRRHHRMRWFVLVGTVLFGAATLCGIVLLLASVG